MIVRPLICHARVLGSQLLVEMKIFFRNREGVFYHFLLPVLASLLLIYFDKEGILESLYAFVGGFVNADRLTGNMRAIDLLLPTVIGYCVIATTFESVAPKLVAQRDEGILKRLGGTPLRKGIFLAAKTVSASIIALVEILIVVSIGLLSNTFVSCDPWSLLAILFVGIFAFAAMGFVVAGIVKNADTAIVAVHAIYMPMLLICGTFLPIEVMPRLLQPVAKALPLTPLLKLLRAALTTSPQFEGGGVVTGNEIAVNAADLFFLLIWGLACLALSVKIFRWTVDRFY